MVLTGIHCCYSLDMCGPQEKCCCFPAVTGVKILAILLTLAELGGLIYTGVNYSDLKVISLTCSY